MIYFRGHQSFKCCLVSAVNVDLRVALMLGPSSELFDAGALE